MNLVSFCVQTTPAFTSHIGFSTGKARDRQCVVHKLIGEEVVQYQCTRTGCH